MLPIEMLVLIGMAAVFPYIADVALSWVWCRGKHAKRADAPD